MIRSRLLRLPGLVHAVIFAMIASFPGLPHGCEMGRAGGAMAMSQAMEHQHSHQHDSPDSNRQKKCHCLGDSCRALGATALPPAPGFQLPRTGTVAVPVAVEVPSFVATRPRFLQPPALGPPLHS